MADLCQERPPLLSKDNRYRRLVGARRDEVGSAEGGREVVKCKVCTSRPRNPFWLSKSPVFSILHAGSGMLPSIGGLGVDKLFLGRAAMQFRQLLRQLRTETGLGIKKLVS